MSDRKIEYRIVLIKTENSVGDKPIYYAYIREVFFVDGTIIGYGSVNIDLNFFSFQHATFKDEYNNIVGLFKDKANLAQERLTLIQECFTKPVIIVDGKSTFEETKK